jgi:hypothetical protein
MRQISSVGRSMTRKVPMDVGSGWETSRNDMVWFVSDS